MSDYSEIAARFAGDTARHQMTVLHDDGLYRHLFFRPSAHSFYWFELISTPGQLVFSGDGESFVFRRTTDMFEFFRSGVWRDGSLHINPGYWAEKLASDRDSVMTYSQKLFNEQVAEELKQAEEFYPGVTAAWQEHTDSVLALHSTEYEETAREALNDFEYLGSGQTGEAFRFQDTWEWNFKDFDWWFLWACYGVVAGIRRYDKARRDGLLGLATRKAAASGREWAVRVPGDDGDGGEDATFDVRTSRAEAEGALARWRSTHPGVQLVSRVVSYGPWVAAEGGDVA